MASIRATMLSALILSAIASTDAVAQGPDDTSLNFTVGFPTGVVIKSAKRSLINTMEVIVDFKARTIRPTPLHLNKQDDFSAPVPGDLAPHPTAATVEVFQGRIPVDDGDPGIPQIRLDYPNGSHQTLFGAFLHPIIFVGTGA